MAAENSIALYCDDFYISILVTSEEFEEDDDVLMSDEHYAEELQFQEAIMSSITIPEKKPLIEVGESSKSLCEICAENKDNDEMYPVQNCRHRICTECISKYITINVQKSMMMSQNQESSYLYTCPGLNCETILDIDACRGILPKYVLSMWDDGICESMIDSSQKYYCPYKDCSGLIVNDGDEVIRESECPFCHRLFCAQCKVPWHSGFECEEYLRLNENERGKEDLMMHELAKKENWKRCGHCKFFVEKSEGCLHMTCRCRHEFCYACGADWTSNHGGCQ
ncbi:hypothetical protein ACJIZ3_010179 [Penstemon smallii]|uniref:RBR-type E3 ubiquitin transferase n=1 Tax=Penstemon smallii TaxID=265156 RepID=A0ABD3TGZ4_9LAMI